MVTDVIASRYQTNKPSFRLISLPSGPVKPARKTEICRYKKAFLMRLQSREVSAKHPNLHQTDKGRIFAVLH